MFTRSNAPCVNFIVGLVQNIILKSLQVSSPKGESLLRHILTAYYSKKLSQKAAGPCSSTSLFLVLVYQAIYHFPNKDGRGAEYTSERPNISSNNWLLFV